MQLLLGWTEIIIVLFIGLGNYGRNVLTFWYNRKKDEEFKFEWKYLHTSLAGLVASISAAIPLLPVFLVTTQSVPLPLNSYAWLGMFAFLFGWGGNDLVHFIHKVYSQYSFAKATMTDTPDIPPADETPTEPSTVPEVAPVEVVPS